MKRVGFLFSLAVAVVFAGRDARAGEGFFHAELIGQRWWLIAPDGKPFISKGVDNVQFAQDAIQGTIISPYALATMTKYGSADAWRAATAGQLACWGFNTLGAWSDAKVSHALKDGKRFAYAPMLDIGAWFVGKKQGGQAWLHGIFPDVFDPDFEKFAYQRAAEVVAGRAEDHWLMGWFIDNELRWGPDWRGKDELLTMFLALPTGTPGRKTAIELLRGRYGEVAKFNEVWNTAFHAWDEVDGAGAIKPPFVRQAVYHQNQEVERKADEADPKRAAFTGDCDAFLGRLAEEYFRITNGAIRHADPNHMNFGCRFAYVPPAPVVAAAAKYVDVISFNCYDFDPRPAIQRYSVFGKPLIIGEFSFRGADSGLPNTKGAGPIVKTQAERAAAFEKYVTLGLGTTALVGYHWFEHADEPKEGRFDGENSNYGVVNIRDEPYEELTRAMTRVNEEAEKVHGAK